MKYTKEIVDRMTESYQAGMTVSKLAEQLQVPERSIIAKLSSLGIYQKKQYLNKQGLPPLKKCDLIEELATKLSVSSEQLESLEKVNKSVLKLLRDRLDPKPPQTSQV
jgi:Zn-dependent peptidase ImmA (M78 family)